ncbi:MAG: hypothetical protein AB1445_03935 [Bacillota bacterium]
MSATHSWVTAQVGMDNPCPRPGNYPAMDPPLLLVLHPGLLRRGSFLPTIDQAYPAALVTRGAWRPGPLDRVRSLASPAPPG